MLIVLLVLFIGAAIAGLQATMGAGDNPWPPVVAASVGATAGLIVFGTVAGAMFYAILCMGAWLAALAVVPEPPQRSYWSPRASSLHLPSQGSTCEFCAGEVPGDACIYCGTKKGEKIPPGEATGSTIRLSQIADCALWQCDEPGVHYLFGKKSWCLCRTHFAQAKEKIERAVASNPTKARYDHAVAVMRELAPLLFADPNPYDNRYRSHIRW